MVQGEVKFQRVPQSSARIPQGFHKAPKGSTKVPQGSMVCPKEKQCVVRPSAQKIALLMGGTLSKTKVHASQHTSNVL